METWKACVQINCGDEITLDNLTFEVSDELYKRMEEEIRVGKPLFDCDFYGQIEAAAKAAVDPALLPSGSKIENVYVNDPGDMNRLHYQFVGRVFPDWAYSSEDFTFEYDDEFPAVFRVTVEFDGEGRIVEIGSVSAKAVGCTVIGNESWGNVYPDFDFLSEVLLEELGDEETEEDGLEDRSDEDYY